MPVTYLGLRSLRAFRCREVATCEWLRVEWNAESECESDLVWGTVSGQCPASKDDLCPLIDTDIGFIKTKISCLQVVNTYTWYHRVHTPVRLTVKFSF